MAEAKADLVARAAAQERLGLVVDERYRIAELLGMGGMGAVYVAEHLGLRKRVALKTLLREYARDPVLVERFHREARAASAIGNEHIVDVTDLGVMPDGDPYLVMELLQGRTLGQMLKAEGPLPIPRFVAIARQLCDALGAAHARGIVHRDLKPDNVFLITRRGDPDFVKLLDFGISKVRSGLDEQQLTATGVALGTPAYMSPEQSQGAKHVDARADVWSLGVMLYLMLAGARPFQAESYPMLLMAIVSLEPDPIARHRRDVPAELEALVLRCLEKRVEDRVASMDELWRGLAPFASGRARAPKGPVAVGRAVAETLPESGAQRIAAAAKAQIPPTRRESPSVIARGEPAAVLSEVPSPAPPRSAPRTTWAWVAVGALVVVALVASVGGVAVLWIAGVAVGALDLPSLVETTSEPVAPSAPSDSYAPSDPFAPSEPYPAMQPEWAPQEEVAHDVEELPEYEYEEAP